MSEGFVHLEQVIQDELFPDIDLRLRRGCHISEGEDYQLLLEARALLEPFYRRYGCELVHIEAGYFYLLPQSDRLGRRQLSVAEMLTGQVLALLYLEPESAGSGGVVRRGEALQLLSNLLGEERVLQALNPRRKRRDERTEQEAARRELDQALRALAQLGFIDWRGEDELRLRPPLLRFADPVRGFADPRAALQRLLERGSAVLLEPTAGAAPAAPPDDDASPEPEPAPDPEEDLR